MKAFSVAWDMAVIIGLLIGFAVAAPAIMLWLAWQHRKARKGIKLVPVPPQTRFFSETAHNAATCPYCQESQHVRYFRDEDPDYEPEDEQRGEVPGV